MNTDERISFFCELISCHYNLNLWTYNEQVELLNTNSLDSDLSTDTIVTLGFADKLKKYGQSLNAKPLLLGTDFGLLWLVAYEYDNNALFRIHVLGPVFTGKNTQMIIKKKLDSYDIGIQLRSEIFKKIKEVPIIPTNILMQHAVMFHYSVTGEKISVDMVNFLSSGLSADKNEAHLISEEHRGIWFKEQQLMKMIREGNSDYKKALVGSMSLSNGVKAEYGDPMRAAKNNTLVLLTLCSRASIEGGLSPSVAYSMNDHYALLIEMCKNIAESNILAARMLEDFVRKVKLVRLQSGLSTQIRTVCDFISIHVKDDISIKILADLVGYTPYYLSHKFKKEMDMTINAYVRQKKIDEAKILLLGTNMSIIEISNDLSFSNRSYFYTCFRKEQGISPLDYRNRNSRKI